MACPPVPAGLSPRSVAVWTELTTAHQFADFELLVFWRALALFDKADGWMRASESVEGAEQVRLVKLSLDASNAGLRFWRQLKFRVGGEARRPGRPSGDNWSARRKLQALHAKAG